MIDLEPLDMTPRSVRPLEEQEERESRRLWDPVTTNMLSKNWNEATKQKQVIEQVCMLSVRHDYEVLRMSTLLYSVSEISPPSASRRA